MLAKYISQIVNQEESYETLSTQRFSDNLTEITRTIHTWLFSDGVILKCTEEMETEYYDNDDQCPEHWITWEIVESNNKPISPCRKEFFNLCQQSFWLKMQLANSQ
ncbi:MULTISPECIES: hypothetical protein [Enterobacterales]|uniref:hypothetical protein n=1 Tax=Enterobacterales TaxID=91347 RepID=UPI0008480841|nr:MULTISPECIES: hypothetical protein [Enterobacterales]WOO51451.1 hypothetical protein R2S03_09925 [Hafnia alvei]MCK9782683.1 hypothetical protein [Proteus columbae]MCT6518085.1 hypothetical protein [Proteus vulgaris]ODQ04662.1 hypothetical protein BGK50_06295 [Shigella sp. FC130]OEI92195.1 hypothetical protein BHE86_07785 [Shigella sp. FC1655]